MADDVLYPWRTSADMDSVKTNAKKQRFCLRVDDYASDSDPPRTAGVGGPLTVLARAGPTHTASLSTDARRRVTTHARLWPSHAVSNRFPTTPYQPPRAPRWNRSPGIENTIRTRVCGPSRAFVGLSVSSAVLTQLVDRRDSNLAMLH